MNWENEVNDIFVISLGSKRSGRFQFNQTFEFSGLPTGIWPSKLTNQSTCTKW